MSGGVLTKRNRSWFRETDSQRRAENVVPSAVRTAHSRTRTRKTAKTGRGTLANHGYATCRTARAREEGRKGAHARDARTLVHPPRSGGRGAAEARRFGRGEGDETARWGGVLLYACAHADTERVSGARYSVAIAIDSAGASALTGSSRAEEVRQSQCASELSRALPRGVLFVHRISARTRANGHGSRLLAER